MKTKPARPVVLPTAVRSRADREANAFLESYNPLRGLTIRRAQMIFDAARRGNDVRLQWIYENLEQSDPTLMICAERRASALVDLDWTIRPKAAARAKGFDQALADEQAAFLEQAYGQAEERNLFPAIERLASAFFRGHAHVRPLWSDDGLGLAGFELLNAWNVCRDVVTGLWHWNPSAAETLDFGSLDPVPEGEIVTLVRTRHIDYPAMPIFLRNALGEKAWGRFLERYGIPPVIITMPPDMDPARVSDYCAAATQVADGGSGRPHLAAFDFETEPAPGPAEVFDLAAKAVQAGYRVTQAELQERTGYALEEAPGASSGSLEDWKFGGLASPLRGDGPTASQLPWGVGQSPTLNRQTSKPPSLQTSGLQGLAEALQSDCAPLAEALQSLLADPSPEAARALAARLPELLPEDPELASEIQTLLDTTFAAESEGAEGQRPSDNHLPFTIYHLPFTAGGHPRLQPRPPRLQARQQWQVLQDQPPRHPPARGRDQGNRPLRLRGYRPSCPKPGAQRRAGKGCHEIRPLLREVGGQGCLARGVWMGSLRSGRRREPLR